MREDELMVWIVVMLALGVQAYIWWQRFRVHRSERALDDAWRAFTEEVRRTRT